MAKSQEKFTTVTVPERSRQQLKQLAADRDLTMYLMAAELIDREWRLRKQYGLDHNNTSI